MQTPWAALAALAVMGWSLTAAESTPWQFRATADNVEVAYQARPLMLCVFTNSQFKPYVKELRTLQGANVLLDAPADHLHHHGLMLAFRVNDLNFWEESPAAGVQLPAPGVRVACYVDPRGEAVIHQRLYWVASAHRAHPDPAQVALLTEERTLRLRVDTALQEVSLDWLSSFTTGTATNLYGVAGSGYNGLGLRPLPSFNRTARRLNPINAPYTEEAKWDVVGGHWGALVGPVEGGEATITIYDQPLNAVPPMFFSMLNPFAYLAATQALDKQPQTYRAGQNFSLRYLVTVHQGARTVEFLNSRAYHRFSPGK